MEYKVSIRIDANTSGVGPSLAAVANDITNVGNAAQSAAPKFNMLGSVLKTAALMTAPGRILGGLGDIVGFLKNLVMLPFKPIELLVGGFLELAKIPFNIISGAIGTVASAIGNIVQIALGGVLFKAIEGIGQLFTSLISNAYQATAQFQLMRVGLEGLLAQEIARGTLAERSFQVANALTDKQVDQLATLKSRYTDLEGSIAIANQRISEWNDKTNESTKMSQTESLRRYQEDLQNTATEIAALEAVTKGTTTVTEQFYVGVRSIAETMPEAQVRAKALMDQLTRVAILSPYQLQDVFDTFRNFMAFQFPAEEAKGMTTALLDMAAGIGADNSMLNRMAYNLAQVRLQNKVTAMDVRQLAQAGLGLEAVLQFVGKQMGINIKDHLDFNKALEEGKITWADFTKYFELYAKTNFGGAAQRMAITLKGLESTMKDLFTVTLPKITQPLVDLIAPHINTLFDAFLTIRDSGVLEAVGAALRSWVAPRLEPVFKFIDTIANFISMPESTLKNEIRAGWKRGLIGDALEEAFGLGNLYDRVTFLVENVIKPAFAGNFVPLGDWLRENVWIPLTTKMGEGFTLLTQQGGWADKAVGFVTGIINDIAAVIQNPSPELSGGLATVATGIGGVIQRALFGWTEEGEGGRQGGTQARHAGLLEVLQNLFRTMADKLSAWLALPETQATFGNIGKGITDALLSFINDADYLTSLAVGLTTAIIDIVKQIDWNKIGIAIYNTMPSWLQDLEKFVQFLHGGTGGKEGLPPSAGGPTGTIQPGNPIEVMPTRASGGWAIAGKSYRINDRGGEMFFPRQTGYVVPNHTLQQSYAYNVNVTDTLAASMMLDMMRRQQRARINAVMG